jgi:hypothetical protein
VKTFLGIAAVVGGLLLPAAATEVRGSPGQNPSGHSSTSTSTGKAAAPQEPHAARPAAAQPKGSSPQTDHGKQPPAKGTLPQTAQGTQQTAKGNQPSGDHGMPPTSKGNMDVAKRFASGAMPYGKSFKGNDGKDHKYQQCPQQLQACSKPFSYCGWSSTCWLPKYGCRGCYCSQDSTWFYWCEPFCCYLPYRCVEQYPPVEVCAACTPATSAAYCAAPCPTKQTCPTPSCKVTSAPCDSARCCSPVLSGKQQAGSLPVGSQSTHAGGMQTMVAVHGSPANAHGSQKNKR